MDASSFHVRDSDLIKTNMMDLGLAGWMADFGEYLPVDVFASHEGGDPYEAHNLLPLYWAITNR